jgi:ubiquinol-cytochrome c reductase cytochrome c1 subunit
MASRVASSTYKSLFGRAVAAGAAAGTAVVGTAYASDDHVPITALPWSHGGIMGAYDTASLRRGYEVYRQVCSTCHAMKLIHFRELVGVTHTEEQAKALADSYEVEDGPNEEGEMFQRHGKLSDHFVSPYANPALARYANGGAMPPDMSCIAKARNGPGPDYIFHLLTGYRDAPAGVELREGLYYNPYFPGGVIGMAPPLNDDGIEYEDGTVATKTQMAKDVCTFLQWASEPEQDIRKKTGMKMMATVFFMALGAGYYKRFKWSTLKSRRITWID